MTLALVVVIDLFYLSYATRLAAFVPPPIQPGAVGLVLFLSNAVVLSSPSINPPGARALATALRVCDGLVRKVGRVVPLLALVGAGLGLRLVVLAREPIDLARAEMLPLIMRGIERVLAGANPYVVHQLPYPMPLTYLPWLWVPMIPAFWLGIDVRLVQALAACATAVLIVLGPWGAGPRLGASRTARLVLAAGFLLCPATVAFVAIGHTALYWLYLVGLFAALAGGRWFLAGLCAGLSGMARQIMWPALVPVALLVWRVAGPAERRRFALGALLAVASAAIFFAGAPMFALWHNLRWYAAFDPYTVPAHRWWALSNPGFAAVLYPLGLVSLVHPIGLVVLALVLLQAWRRVTDVETAARSVALALLAVTLTAAAPFRYEFIPVVLVVMVAALLTPLPVDGPPAPGADDR